MPKWLIDANYLRNKMIRNCPVEDGGIPLKDFNTHQKILELYPTVDAVEVVRCRNCKFYTEQKKRCDHPCQDWDVECYDQWLEMEPDDFCSYGERKNK